VLNLIEINIKPKETSKNNLCMLNTSIAPVAGLYAF
jgi:hypothetical protein